MNMLKVLGPASSDSCFDILNTADSVFLYLGYVAILDSTPPLLNAAAALAWLDIN
jgi:hypothetical protein